MNEQPTQFVIEKGIPLPARRCHGRQYPFSIMEVGDSFFVAVSCSDNDEKHREQQTVSAYARVYGQRHNRKFSTRRLDGGVRVWRVA